MDWYKQAQNIVQIQMTPAELDWADWAIGPMSEYWTTEDGAYDRGDFETDKDGPIYEEYQLPKIQGNILFIFPNEEMIEDLLYRLEDQALTVSDADSYSNQQTAAKHRPALNLSKKIRAAIGGNFA